MSSLGLYGNGMHDFVLRELEVGFRVACAEDDEAIGMGPLFNLQYMIYLGLYDNQARQIADGEKR